MLFLPVFLAKMYFCVLEEENGKKTAKKYFFVGVE